MKRLISLFIAVVLVFSLLPTIAFAEEGKADAGYTIKYDIGGFMDSREYRWNESGPWLANMTYDTTNGLFEFVKTTVLTLKDDDGSTVSKTNTYGGKNRSSNLTVDTGFANRSLQLKGTVVFKIKVPVSGTYNIDVNYREAQNKPDGIVSLYITDYIIDKVEEETPVGKFSCNTTETVRGSIDLRVKANDAETDAEITLDAGEYYLTINSGEYGYIRSLSLVSGDGSKAFLNNIKATIDRTVLIPGTADSTKINIVGMYMSDAGAVSDMSKYPVSYKSSNESVAAVAADGTVTAGSEGNAVITVSSVNEIGDVVSCEVPIIVRDDIKVLYDVNNDMTSLGMTWLSNGDNTIDESGKTAFQRRPSVYELNFESTDGFYAFHSAGQGVLSDTNQTDDNQLKYTTANKKGTFQVRRGNWMALEIYVPEAGTYDFEMYVNETTGFPGIMKVFISDRAGNIAEKNYVGTYTGYNATPSTAPVAKRIGSQTFEKAGNYIVTFTNVTSEDKSALVDSFALVRGTKGTIINGKITSTADSINFDNGETATVSATGFISSTTEAATFTYSSNNTNVATVDAETGVVTPVSEGKATITATAAGATVANTLTKDITVTVNKPGEAVADEVSLYITGTTGGSVSADKVAVDTVTSAAAGTEITAEAAANEGYKFAYWKDSAGNVVSSDAEYTFKAFTNTSIVAVFDNVSEEGTTFGVEFFDGNRDYLGFAAADKGATFESVLGSMEDEIAPNLTGYEFKGWSIAGDTVINAVLRAVALYEEEGKEVSGVKVNGSAKTETKYDDEIKETVSGAKTWYRDDKLVGYGDTYTYYVWGSTEITSSDAEVDEKLPIAVLNTNGESYMLEYDAAGYEIVDAGILFGDETHKTVNACYYKAKVRNIKNHGQFTAKSANGDYPQSIVRGYVMFRVGDDIRVIYAD